MHESSEPIEYGIFDFYKVFSRAFGGEEDGAGGELEWKVGDVVTTPFSKSRCARSLPTAP